MIILPFKEDKVSSPPSNWGKVKSGALPHFFSSLEILIGFESSELEQPVNVLRVKKNKKIPIKFLLEIFIFHLSSMDETISFCPSLNESNP